MFGPPTHYYYASSDDDEDDVIISSHKDMPKLKPGDTVSCKVKASVIVAAYKSYDEIHSFVIVAADSEGYYVFVPVYLNIKNSIVADQYRCRGLQIDKKYLNENIVHITERQIASIVTQDEGVNCKICKEFARFAGPNQTDGSFICYSCKINPYH